MNQKLGTKKRRVRAKSSRSAREPETPIREQPHEEDGGEAAQSSHVKNLQIREFSIHQQHFQFA
jgi:hypothetical protein